jgi:hypothetical protein
LELLAAFTDCGIGFVLRTCLEIAEGFLLGWDTFLLEEEGPSVGLFDIVKFVWFMKRKRIKEAGFFHENVSLKQQQETRNKDGIIKAPVNIKKTLCFALKQ